MKAYDLWFETGEGIAQSPNSEPTREVPTTPPDGWIGGAGPALGQMWPRGPLTGLPMFHALTLRLPAAYRRRGEELTHISFFQGEGQFAEEPEPDARGWRRTLRGSRDPFDADLKLARVHPRMERRSDCIDGQFALLWLTDAEVAAGPSAPPPDVRRTGEHTDDDEGPNAWDTQAPTCRVWLMERDDPNAGLAPADPLEADGVPGYTTPLTPDFERLPWAEPLGTSHLGGTSLPVQQLPEGLTPFYLEIEQLPGLNFGEGIAQLDLESDVFDWACD